MCLMHTYVYFLFCPGPEIYLLGWYFVSFKEKLPDKRRSSDSSWQHCRRGMVQLAHINQCAKSNTFAACRGFLLNEVEMEGRVPFFEFPKVC